MKPEMTLKIKEEVKNNLRRVFWQLPNTPNGWQMLCLYQRKTEKYECV